MRVRVRFPSWRTLLGSAALIVSGALAAGLVAIPAQGSAATAAVRPRGDSGAFAASLPGEGRVGLAELAGLATKARTVADPVTPSPIAVPYAPSKCEALTGKRCYEVFPHLARAYGLDQLHGRGWTGKGATVAVLLPFRNAHVQRDLDVFSRRNGLPRAKVEKITLPGTRAPDPANPAEVVCAQEGTVDVEMIHAAAPHAKIIYVETPVGESSDGSWLGSVAEAIDDLTRTRQVDAISMSYGAFEANFAEESGSPEEILKLRKGLQAASARGTTLLAATGNTGATGPRNDGKGFYSEPTIAWPAGDPVVTAVGGTRIHLSDNGRRMAADEVWTAERSSAGIEGATGGGRSEVFPRPAWQPARLGRMRAIPDLASNASPSSPVWFYSTYQAFPDKPPGWFNVGGTSIAAPLITGVVAAAAGKAGPLGNINPRLYRAVQAHGAARTGLQDLVKGCNTANGVTGHCARPGPDAVSGLGSIHNAPRLAAVLATHGRTRPTT